MNAWPLIRSVRNPLYSVRMSTVTRCVKRRFIIRAVRNRQNPLPDTLPASLFDSGYDDQQLQLIVSLSQHARHHLTNLKQEQWLTGQPDADRSDIFVLKSGLVPATGLNTETLPALLSNNQSARHFAGQQRTYWLNKDNQPSVTVPSWPPRRSYTDTAELDETITAAIKSGTDITEQLLKTGYIKADYLFAGTSETGKRSGLRAPVIRLTVHRNSSCCRLPSAIIR